MKKTPCSFHCVAAAAEFGRAAYYRRLAQRFHAEGNREMAEHYKGHARTCHDVGRMFRDQLPHGYVGGLSYGYVPADPKAPNRRMTILTRG